MTGNVCTYTSPLSRLRSNTFPSRMQASLRRVLSATIQPPSCNVSSHGPLIINCCSTNIACDWEFHTAGVLCFSGRYSCANQILSPSRPNTSRSTVRRALLVSSADTYDAGNSDPKVVKRCTLYMHSKTKIVGRPLLYLRWSCSELKHSSLAQARISAGHRRVHTSLSRTQ